MARERRGKGRGRESCCVSRPRERPPSPSPTPLLSWPLRQWPTALCGFFASGHFLMSCLHLDELLELPEPHLLILFLFFRLFLCPSFFSFASSFLLLPLLGYFLHPRSPSFSSSASLLNILLLGLWFLILLPFASLPPFPFNPPRYSLRGLSPLSSFFPFSSFCHLSFHFPLLRLLLLLLLPFFHSYHSVS